MTGFGEDLSVGPLLVRVDGPVATITLNRPERFNALDFEMAAALTATADRLRARPGVGAVVLTGAGPSFCAGGDVIAMAAATDRGDFLSRLAGAVHTALRALAELPIVLVGAARGAVAGGGLGLLLSCDLIVLGAQTTITAAYPGVGLTPDSGTSTLLPRSIGLHRALHVLVGGRRLSAADALDWGLATEVVADAEVIERATALARSLAGTAPHAVGAARALVRENLTATYPEALNREARTIADAAGRPEASALIERFARRAAAKAQDPPEDRTSSRNN